MFVQDIFVELEMTGMVEVMFRQTPPTPSNFLIRFCVVKFFLGDSVLYKVSEYISFFLHSDSPLWHNLSFCDFRFKYLANYCIMFWMFNMAHTHHPKTQLDFLDLENFLVKVWGGGGGGRGYGVPDPPPPTTTTTTSKHNLTFWT